MAMADAGVAGPMEGRARHQRNRTGLFGPSRGRGGRAGWRWLLRVAPSGRCDLRRGGEGCSVRWPPPQVLPDGVVPQQRDLVAVLDGRQSEEVPTDLVEIAEQIVCACAEMDCGIEPWARTRQALL